MCAMNDGATEYGCVEADNKVDYYRGKPGISRFNFNEFEGQRAEVLRLDVGPNCRWQFNNFGIET